MHDGNAEPESRGGVRGVERTVRAGVARHQVAEGIA